MSQYFVNPDNGDADIKRTVDKIKLAGLFLLISVGVSASLPTSCLADENPEDVDEKPLAWTERIHLTGTIEGDFVWERRSDIENRDSDGTSNLFVSTVELGVQVDFTDWLSIQTVFTAEDLGTEDETGVIVDEATVTVSNDEFPLFAVFGKRTLPFGVFENHLVEGPLTEDAYETVAVGFTGGYAGPVDSELNATVYRGDVMMENLFDSELFDTGTVTRREGAGNDVSSFIVSASISPLEEATLFGSLLTEPGTDRRNVTAGAGLSMEVEPVRFDGEYMGAVKRERYSGFQREFRESAYSFTAAYEIVFREREVIGGALFAERKAHRVSEPFEISVRYEHFDDDGLADASRTWSVRNKYSAGARYAFYYDEESGLAAYIAAEYRHTGNRVHRSRRDEIVDENDEVFVRLGVTF